MQSLDEEQIRIYLPYVTVSLSVIPARKTYRNLIAHKSPKSLLMMFTTSIELTIHYAEKWIGTETKARPI